VHRVFQGTEVRIEERRGGVCITPGRADLAGEVRHYLGGPFDLDPFYAFAETEPVLARIVPELRGFRPPLSPDPYETLVSAITAQQISLRAAFAVRNRFIQAFGVKTRVAYAFPTRERVALAEPEEIVVLGFSRRKAEYTLGIARSDLDLVGLAALPDDEVKAALTSLFLGRHLARPDAWPAGDLGLRKAVLHFYGEEDTRAAGDRFPGFRNLTAHYLLTGHRVLGG
jgi:DNA-3-methyladenine glycosylase II